MTRNELIGLGQRILAEEDDDVLDGLMAEFDRNVPHPEGSSLFFLSRRLERPQRRPGGLRAHGGRSGGCLFGLPPDLPVKPPPAAEQNPCGLYKTCLNRRYWLLSRPAVAPSGKASLIRSKWSKS
ncbi:Uncharacterised protein [Helicobacter pametensis]|nr:Uncharacterised protein [Helicobacter pametensis]